MRFTYQTGAQPLAGYTIQRGIHRGGFGEVYFANSAGGKEVALKLLHQEDRDIEIRGVTQCLNLKHPNLVNLFDVKTDDQGDHWVVMEYVGGSSLEDVLTSFPNGLPLNEIRDWLIGLVAGVAHLHERGIVHRDLKPANVYRENGIVKVGDVGLSKRLDSDGRRQHTQSVGTVYYMAPEVARGQYGPEVDVYSLGVMLYEMMTGKLPFDGETTAEILMKHLTAQPDLSVISPSFRPTLARALEKDPAKRTTSVRQLEREFMNALSSPVSGQEALTIPESSFLPPLPAKQDHSKSGRSESLQSPTNSTNNGQVSSPIVEMEPKWMVIDKLIIVYLIILLCGILFRMGLGTSPRSVHPTWVRLAVVAMPVIIYLLYRTLSSRSRSRLINTSAKQITSPNGLRNAKNVRAQSTACVPELKTTGQVVHELAGSIGSAGVAASFLSAGLYWIMKESAPRLMPTTELTVFYAAVSIVGSWVILAMNSLIRDFGLFRQRQLLLRLMAGAGIGLVAFELHRFLNVEFPRAAYSAESVVKSIGGRPLTELNHSPTQLGYTVFFAVFLGIRNWTKSADPSRKKRFSIRSIIAAVILGFLAAKIIEFPQWYAMLWAGTIGATIQLASNWNPKPIPVNGR